MQKMRTRQLGIYLVATFIGVFIELGEFAHAEVLRLQQNDSDLPYKIQVLSTSIDETMIKLSVFQLETQPAYVDGNLFTRISLKDASLTHDLGLPEVPKINSNIMIPQNSQVTMTIVKMVTQKLSLGKIVPSKGSLLRDVNPDDVAYKLSDFYYNSTDYHLYPKQNAWISTPFMLRDVRGVTLHFNPVQYDSLTGESIIVTEMVVKISNVKNPGQILSLMKISQNEVVEGFSEIYQNSFINYSQLATLSSVNASPGDHWVKEKGQLLIVTHPSFKKGLTPLVQWKKQRGFDVKLVTLAETGSTATAIKDYIQQVFNKEQKLAYILLVGDAQQIPYYPGTAGNAVGREADPMYGLTVGNDSYPDIIVGRLSVQTEVELATVVNKSINYEKYPDPQGDWYAKASGIASAQGDPTDGARAEELRTMLSGWHYTSVDKFYDSSQFVKRLVLEREITQAINEGRGFINYIGHGSETAWVTSGFSTRSIDALNNQNRLPVIVSVACVNGRFNFSQGDVFAERWLKAGTPQTPKGAVAVFASSTNQAWVPPTIGQKQIVNLLVKERATTVGSLMMNGSVAVLDDDDVQAVQTFQTWHIFGDPTLQMRTQKPRAIAVNIPDSISGEADELALDLQTDLDIQNNDQVVQATLLRGTEIISSGLMTSQDKSLILKFDNDKLDNSSNIILTLSGFNRIPVEKVIEIK